MTKKKHRFLSWLGKKFRLIVYHGNSYDVIRKFRFNRLGLIAFMLGMFCLVVVITYVSIAYTPLKHAVPGYPDFDLRKTVMECSIRADSLVHEMEIRDHYLQMVRDIIFNEVPIDENFVVPTAKLTDQYIRDFNDPTISRKDVEIKKLQAAIDAIPDLYKPLEGVVVDGFDPGRRHLGTDIATKGETTIHAVLQGTVVFADFTIETGYTLAIQHPNDLISIYKHNKELLAKVGDHVNTGQAVAIYGNSGDLTTGPHLHFELWHKGSPVDAEKYLHF